MNSEDNLKKGIHQTEEMDEKEINKLNNAKDKMHSNETDVLNENANKSSNNTISGNNKAYIIDEDTVCGFGCFRPKWIQKYATPRAYLISFSLVCTVQASYFNYFIAAMSTLEKRFAFDAKVSAILVLAEEITPLVLGIPIGYIGGKAHRPRLVALGMFLTAACCFATTVPYFVYGSAKHLTVQPGKNETNLDFCESESDHSSCDLDTQPPTMTVVGIFLFASFLRGFSVISTQVVGISYLDDVAKKKNSPLYLAITMALRLLGPLFGFLMSSAFLKIYENPFEDPGFGPEDPRWIGGWWIGFLLQGVLLVIFSIPVMLFPRRLPSHKKPQQNPSQATKESIKDMLKGIFPSIMRLLKNPIFVIICINILMIIYGHVGHGYMVPKYMENQFRISASNASLYSGGTKIFCIIVATLIGGIIIWKYSPSAKLLLGLMVISETTYCLAYLVLMIPQCQKQEMFHFGTNDEGLILESVCNQNCNCSTTAFTPYCSSDGKTLFFSPCFAGCLQQLDPTMLDKEQHKEFENCSCVFDESGGLGGKITEGYCVDENCWTQTKTYIYLLIGIETITNLLNVAHTIIFLRCIQPADKSIALGAMESLNCLLGFIPIPIIFAALVDSACIIWEKSCGKKGNCWFYDLDKYNYLIHGVSATFCGLSACCLSALFFLSSRMRNIYEEDEDDENDHDEIKLDNISGPVTKL